MVIDEIIKKVGNKKVGEIGYVSHINTIHMKNGTPAYRGVYI